MPVCRCLLSLSVLPCGQLVVRAPSACRTSWNDCRNRRCWLKHAQQDTPSSLLLRCPSCCLLAVCWCVALTKPLDGLDWVGDSFASDWQLASSLLKPVLKAFGFRSSSAAAAAAAAAAENSQKYQVSRWALSCKCPMRVHFFFFTSNF